MYAERRLDPLNVLALIVLPFMHASFSDAQVTLPGSTTVCLLQLDDTGALHACNLGDSGFRVVRKGQMVFASSVQEVTFNMPYQLGCALAARSLPNAPVVPRLP